MHDVQYGKIIREGLWDNNQALAALLGLCPLLAVTSTAANGLGLGIATTVVLACSNMVISLIRNIVRPEVRLPIFVLVIAAFVTAVELAMNAWFYDLYKVLGIFIALIVTNCIIIGRAEAFAFHHRVIPSLVDGLSVGVGFTLVLATLGGLRELIGMGTLFSQLDLLLGPWAKGLTFSLGPDFQGMLLAILPPGAFIGLGLLIVVKNLIDQRLEAKARTAVPVSEAVPAGAE